ncbi:Gfo/Idh/MocA family protein [Sinorhizobium mexicanum]|uniref:Gfo/Idh/MocA family oxidoreductase n=1 Tax=Sinorhizobium mexicanum TaxID=375549 RepID=A0A859QRK1_9HYPH|nr:Gfo/Idh/MocA family oxidoreductase [Sinorhizobium mexicanum]MBP1884047.1 putative dehydrogenase [Sinorhizobium mexicanum]QLL64767.1 Gfo/Idh/MocA family oxidoreductase [Sinorhizobium mexicanum]
MQISVGLIGLGEVAQIMHLPLLADHPGFRIAGVCDVSPMLVEAMGVRYGARLRTTHVEEMLAAPDIDAVFILAPDYLHSELLAKAIEAGKHVFIEKPVCLTRRELLPLIERNRNNPKTVFVGYMRRYARPFLELKKRMPPAEEIRHVRIRDLIRESRFFVDQTRHILRATDVPATVITEGRTRTQALLREVIGADRPNHAVRAYQVLTGLSSHSFSAMRELLGPPKGVAAARQSGGESLVALFDYGHFTAVYEAVIHDVARFDSGIEVLTQNRQYKINYDTPYVRNLPTRLEITSSTDTETGTEIIGPFYEDAFRVELGAFHDCVTQGTRPKTDLEDSLADLDLFAEVGRHF